MACDLVMGVWWAFARGCPTGDAQRTVPAMTDTTFDEVLANTTEMRARVAARWARWVDDVEADIIAAMWEAHAAGERDVARLKRLAETACRHAARRAQSFQAPVRLVAGYEVPSRMLGWRSLDRVALAVDRVAAVSEVDVLVDRLAAQQTLSAAGELPAVVRRWLDPVARRQLTPTEMNRCLRWRNTAREQLVKETSNAA